MRALLVGQIGDVTGMLDLYIPMARQTIGDRPPLLDIMNHENEVPDNHHVAPALYHPVTVAGAQAETVVALSR